MNMRTPQDHTGFTTRLDSIRRGVFLPKYYNPEIAGRLKALKKTHSLIRINELIEKNYLTFSTGDEIGKMAYGTGSIPFIRTSDVSNWELKTDAKQGISKEIHADYEKAQDVRAGDIFLVRDGTYLIGQIALVMESDLPLLYQSHIIKFRVSPESPITPALLLACLSTPIVKRQIRSKQFTADIIDTVGDRWKELVLPVPRNPKVLAKIAQEVDALTSERSRLRDKIRKIPYWVEGVINRVDEPLPPNAIMDVVETGNPGFSRSLSAIQNGVFIPKYHDPSILADFRAIGKTHRPTSIGQLVEDGILSWETGIEVGKMAYGTGDIPFIRTSDISNWELKGDPKQAVSEDIYQNNKQNVCAGDIFVVRDGTYLVGTSCILTQKDTRILFCGGLYKLRVEQPDKIDPYLLLALLNTPIVRRQMRSKQFTRDIIDTLGKRLFEVFLPIPKNRKLRATIANETRAVIDTRARLRDRTKQIALEVEGIETPNERDLESLVTD